MKIRPFELERYFARHEFSAPFLLCSSDVEPFALSELLALADKEGRMLWERLTLGYTESPGHPLLREQIARLYDGLSPDDVLLFSGAQEAVFAFGNVALGPGDHAVVVWPAYQSLYEVARAAGADVTLVELRHEDGWRLDLDAVRRALRPSTRAIVVNFPHNPTGTQLERPAFGALVELAEEAGAHLLSDEVYRWLELDRAERLPAAATCSPRALSLGVMSKTFALPGLRIGWVASRDRELLQRLAAFKDYTTICNSAPSEVLALIALRRIDEVVARSRGIVEANMPLLDDFFARWGGVFEWVRPRGASIGFPRLSHAAPVDDFARDLLEAEGVLLLPGSVYQHAGNHFRLGFGRRNLPEALERLERFAAARLG